MKMKYNVSKNELPAKIIEKPVKPVMIRAYCKNCGEELVRSNEVLLSSPPQYQYRCKCGIDFCSFEQFPRISYHECDESEE